MSIKTLLLLGGIEVIANVEQVNSFGHNKEKALGYHLHRPLRVELVSFQTPQGVAMAVQFKPLCATIIQETIYLAADDILGQPMEPTKQAEQTYLQQTTGIQIAQ